MELEQDNNIDIENLKPENITEIILEQEEIIEKYKEQIDDIDMLIDELNDDK